MPEPNALEINLEIPATATDQQVKESVTEAALKADSIHRSLGGHGLAVQDVEIHQATGSRSLVVEVPAPDTLPRFAVYFTFKNKTWTTYIHASSFDEAERRVEALKETAWLDGRMMK